MEGPRATAKPVKNICNDDNEKLNLKEDFQKLFQVGTKSKPKTMEGPRTTAKPMKNICNDDNEILNMKEDFHSYMKKEYQKICNEE